MFTTIVRLRSRRVFSVSGVVASLRSFPRFFRSTGSRRNDDEKAKRIEASSGAPRKVSNRIMLIMIVRMFARFIEFPICLTLFRPRSNAEGRARAHIIGTFTLIVISFAEDSNESFRGNSN